MRSSFSRACVALLCLMASGCYSNGKWTMPWQSSSPFSSSSTPSSTNLAGAPKPATLAHNTNPPSGVTGPTTPYPTYPGSAPGMNNPNNIAPAFQPGNPPSGGTSAAAFTASSNNAASRSGGSIAPQQGAYPSNNLGATSGNYPAGDSSMNTQPYSATNTSYSTSPSNGAPIGGSGAAPNYGSSSGAQPNSGSYPYGSNNSTNSGVPSNPSIPGPSIPQTQPMTGTYNGGWDTIQNNNPVRPPEQPAYGANANTMNAQPYGNSPSPTNGDPRNVAPSNDSRYDLPPDPNSPLPNAAPTSPNNSYGPTPSGNIPPRDPYTPSDAPSHAPNNAPSSNSNGYYQPGSVTSYDAANKPAVLTASPNPTTTWR